MKLNIIDENAEENLDASILALEFRNDAECQCSIDFLHMKFFHIEFKPNAEDFLSILSETEDEGMATLFFCRDKDVIIRFEDAKSDTIESLIFQLAKKYQAPIENVMSLEEFFVRYDSVSDRAKLKKLAASKVGKTSKQSRDLAQYFTNETLIKSLRNTIVLTAMQRKFRKNPSVLIVDDQIFSQKILSSILSDYTTFVAGSCAEALMVYMEKCPDIVFLDIELPDISGHKFASLLAKIDDESYVIMVSGNKYEDDIRKAQENGIRKFIAKPYEKDLILECVEGFRGRKRA